MVSATQGMEWDPAVTSILPFYHASFNTSPAAASSASYIRKLLLFQPFLRADGSVMVVMNPIHLLHTGIYVLLLLVVQCHCHIGKTVLLSFEPSVLLFFLLTLASPVAFLFLFCFFLSAHARRAATGTRARQPGFPIARPEDEARERTSVWLCEGSCES